MAKDSTEIEFLTIDPETGQTADKTVVATIVGEGDKDLVEVTVDVDGDTGAATDILVATDGHPFWVADVRDWVDATDLQPGQWLQTSAGTWVQVTAVKRWTEPARVHNLTIDDIHTYYVLAGNTPVLVYNCPAKVPNLKEFPDVSHLRGADPEEVLDAIPDHWIASTPKKLPAGSDGIRFSNPKAPGQSIIYEEGWPGHSDPVHQGPYLRVSDGTQKTYRIPLAGNPGL